VRLLHRDRFVDIDRAADLEDRAALRELDRRLEAVCRHERVAAQATRAGSPLSAPATLGPVRETGIAADLA